MILLNIRVFIDIASSIHVDMPVEEAIRFLELLGSRRWVSKDLSETLRILRSFDEYYESMRKKLLDYIFVPKDPADSITGKSTVQKIKLYVNGGVKRVELILDRRLDSTLVKSVLEEMGYRNVVIETS